MRLSRNLGSYGTISIISTTDKGVSKTKVFRSPLWQTMYKTICEKYLRSYGLLIFSFYSLLQMMFLAVLFLLTLLFQNTVQYGLEAPG